MAYIVLYPDGNADFRAGNLNDNTEAMRLCGEGFASSELDRAYVFYSADTGDYVATMWFNNCGCHTSARTSNHPPVNDVATRIYNKAVGNGVIHGVAVITGRNAFSADRTRRHPLPLDAQQNVIEAMGETA